MSTIAHRNLGGVAPPRRTAYRDRLPVDRLMYEPGFRERVAEAIDAVCAVAGITEAELFTVTRGPQRVARWRQAAYWWLFEEVSLSDREIAAMFNRRHPTVVEGRAKAPDVHIAAIRQRLSTTYLPQRMTRARIA